MKKVLLVTAAGMMLFASCTKTRTCECTYIVGGSSVTYTETYLMTKKDAKAECETNQTSNNSCDLK